MNIAILFHRWADVSARYGDGSPIVHPAQKKTAQIIHFSRQTALRAKRGHTARWHVSPVSGRLECSWLFAGPPGGRDPFFERLGTIMAGRERCRSGGMAR